MFKKCYVVGPWVQQIGDDGMMENIQALYRDYGHTGKIIMHDITGQPGHEIADGSLCVYLVEAHQEVLDAINSDPLYRIIPLEGKPSKRELDDLNANKNMKPHIDGAEQRHKSAMTNEHLKNSLCEAFRKQGQKVEV